jgi:hypothetical protein
MNTVHTHDMDVMGFSAVIRVQYDSHVVVLPLLRPFPCMRRLVRIVH